MTAAISAMPSPTRNGTALDPMLVGSERAALSALVNGVPKALAKLPEMSPALFIVPAHREIFCAIRNVYEGGQAEVSAFTVTHRLNDIGRLDQVGGPSEVTGISLEATSAAIFDYSLEVMRDAARDRDASRIVDSYLSGELTLEEMREQLAEIDARQRTDFPTITDAADLVEHEKDTPPDLVDGLLHNVGKLVFGGSSKAFKR